MCVYITLRDSERLFEFIINILHYLHNQGENINDLSINNH